VLIFLFLDCSSLSTNEAETELLVNNNNTIVIGGIVKTTDNQSSSRIPFLSRIPLLGKLFKTDLNEDKRNELLIFITPSIVQLDQKRNHLTSQTQ
jgi:type IV pilus assembly protein PilQ